MPPGTAPASKREIKWGVEVSCMSPAKSIVPVTWNLKGGQVCYTPAITTRFGQDLAATEPQALATQLGRDLAALGKGRVLLNALMRPVAIESNGYPDLAHTERACASGKGPSRRAQGGRVRIGG